MAWFDDAPAPAAPEPISAEAIAALDWAGLNAAVASCTRCDLCRSRKAAVPGHGAHAARWLVLASAPGRADEKAGRPVSGDASILLDNMLRAAGLEPGRDAYLTHLLKCRADAAPTSAQLAACRPYLERELALTQARTVLAIGQPAAAGLLGAQAAARGAVRRLGAVAVVATYHPDELLRQGENKAKAWADLCLARSAHDAAT